MLEGLALLLDSGNETAPVEDWNYDSQAVVLLVTPNDNDQWDQ